jgi:succinate dehydrogenase / fumarate reductase cytochrome b subunit
MSAVSAEHRADPTFIRARLGSMLAFAPLSVWTVAHLWNNLAAFDGAEAWQTSVTSYAHPLAHFATLVVVLLPLVIHIVWGLGRLRTSKPNTARYRNFSNLRYLLQRLAAVGVLFFLGAHIWLAMIHPRYVEGRPEPFADIAHEMHYNGPTLPVYLLGTLGVCYHLANGLSTLAMGWGFATSQRALKKVEGVSLGIFIVLLAMSWGTIYALWKAGT